ncbi:MAG: MFS transporter [Actinomycetota bacterium]|nr:MFS transporter [Actinomycetota bacterium]
MRSLSRVRLGGVTALAMAIATFPFTVYSVLGPDLIEEFGISRAQLGILATATGLVGALSSPYWGKVTDRVGSLASTRAVLGFGGVTLLGIAFAPSYLLLVAAAVLTGIANGWCNPATNSLIVDTLPPGTRGVVTGVKQSGVALGTFLGGALLPAFTLLWGWRGAAAFFVVMPMLGLLGLTRTQRSDHHEIDGERGVGKVPVSVIWVAIYGAFSGLATSAMFVFLPLFAEEDQLWSAQAAGSLIAVIGALGVVARVIWPSISERRLGHGPTLRILSVISSVSALLLALAALDVVGSWVLIPSAVLLAAGSIAWNAVGMLAVMDFSPRHLVGKGTGVVLLGFLAGYSLGSPIMGFSVDQLGSYAAGWLGATLLLVIASVIAGRIPSGSTLADA